jgi:hypothetical protein
MAAGLDPDDRRLIEQVLRRVAVPGERAAGCSGATLALVGKSLGWSKRKLRKHRGPVSQIYEQVCRQIQPPTTTDSSDTASSGTLGDEDDDDDSSDDSSASDDSAEGLDEQELMLARFDPTVIVADASGTRSTFADKMLR